MIPRYANADVAEIWSDGSKLDLWQRTELAVIEARTNLGIVEPDIFRRIRSALEQNPIQIEWWLAKDKEIGHDLNAFIEERLRFLPIELQRHFHEQMTSYDTEEAAFAKMLRQSVGIIEDLIVPVKVTLQDMARRYRYTPMNGRTHGQEAELQSFGKRCLTWLVELETGHKNFQKAQGNLQYSKLSGAIGNYRGMTPEIEREALKILGFEPFYGATQIIPRGMYAPLAQALCQIVMTLHKIAIDIRLGARSGNPICQEPFGKKQKGSSAMPHKKNTIRTEQIGGMKRLAKGFADALQENIMTWEERAIEQSSVERVAWPGLFHVAAHSLKTMYGVLSGLVVYPDNMLREIVNSRGCYASGEAKEFLRKHGVSVGLDSEAAYRIVQLAAFNAFEPFDDDLNLRANPNTSLEAADDQLFRFAGRDWESVESIEEIILQGDLRVSKQLDASQDVVDGWNKALRSLFSADLWAEWAKLFKPSHLLKGEDVLFKQILG